MPCRAKDLIIRGGENISCAEVEGAFFGIDSYVVVVMVAVVAVVAV